MADWPCNGCNVTIALPADFTVFTTVVLCTHTVVSDAQLQYSTHQHMRDQGERSKQTFDYTCSRLYSTVVCGLVTYSTDYLYCTPTNVLTEATTYSIYSIVLETKTTGEWGSTYRQQAGLRIFGQVHSAFAPRHRRTRKCTCFPRTSRRFTLGTTRAGSGVRSRGALRWLLGWLQLPPSVVRPCFLCVAWCGVVQRGWCDRVGNWRCFVMIAGCDGSGKAWSGHSESFHYSIRFAHT